MDTTAPDASTSTTIRRASHVFEQTSARLALEPRRRLGRGSSEQGRFDIEDHPSVEACCDTSCESVQPMSQRTRVEKSFQILRDDRRARECDRL